MKLKVINIIFLFCCILIDNQICNAGIDTLAVTPFQVIGDAANADIYSHGLPDAIANDLSRISGITVIERLRLSAVLQELKLSQTGVINEQYASGIGELLGANVIIVGTVQKLGPEVRVHARAVSVGSGEILFSVKAERKIKLFSDVFKLEDILAQKIISQLGLKISREKLDEIEEDVTFSEDAFKLYSSGFKYFDSGDYENALKHFKKATEIDEHFDWAQTVRMKAQKAFEELERELKQ